MMSPTDGGGAGRCGGAMDFLPDALARRVAPWLLAG